jgi:hypothetical protein
VDPDLDLHRFQPRPLEAEVEARIVPAAAGAPADQGLLEEVADGVESRGSGGRPVTRPKQRRAIRGARDLEALRGPPDRRPALGESVKPAAEQGRQPPVEQEQRQMAERPGRSVPQPDAGQRKRELAVAEPEGQAGRADARVLAEQQDQRMTPDRRAVLGQKLEAGRQQGRGDVRRQIGDRHHRREAAGRRQSEAVIAH